MKTRFASRGRLPLCLELVSGTFLQDPDAERLWQQSLRQIRWNRIYSPCECQTTWLDSASAGGIALCMQRAAFEGRMEGAILEHSICCLPIRVSKQ